MTILYGAGFQVGGTNTMQATVAGSGATITNGLYLAGPFDTTNLDTYTVAGPIPVYTAFTAAVKAAFDTATGVANFTVSLSLSTGKYTVSRGSNFTLAFSTAAELRLRDALGFSGNKSGASTYTSDFVPHYIMVAAIPGITNVSNLQEPDDVAEETVSDGGDASVITRKTDEFQSRWIQSMEPISSTYVRARNAAGLSTWTWQEFIKHVRGSHPFWVYDSEATYAVDGTCHRMMAEGAAFKPQRVTSDFDDYWNINFQTRDLGQFA